MKRRTAAAPATPSPGLRPRRLPWRGALAALLLGALAGQLPGCAASPEPRYYTLDSSLPTRPGSPAAPAPLASPAALDAARPASLGVALVQLPRLYTRPQIVTRSGTNAVELHDLHRWAGALDEDITRALARRLTVLTGETIIAAPWSAQAAPARQLTVVIDRLDGTPGSHATLTGRWQITDRNGGPGGGWQTFTLSRATNGHDMPAYVAALERLVDELGGVIARLVRP